MGLFTRAPRDPGREPAPQRTPSARETAAETRSTAEARSARTDAPFTAQELLDAQATAGDARAAAREPRDTRDADPPRRDAERGDPPSARADDTTRGPVSETQVRAREALQPPDEGPGSSTHEEVHRAPPDVETARAVAATSTVPAAATSSADPAPSGAAGAPAGAAETLAPLFTPEAMQHFRGRWDGVQIGFVDDPERAVVDADALVREVLQSLADSFARQHEHLHGQAEAADATESRRLALRRYRSFFQRLLAL